MELDVVDKVVVVVEQEEQTEEDIFDASMVGILDAMSYGLRRRKSSKEFSLGQACDLSTEYDKVFSKISDLKSMMKVCNHTGTVRYLILYDVIVYVLNLNKYIFSWC
ncbi:hypothetical protein O6P43_012880 [Quillaja saponaria]|uniref:Uncharacterized protein n=1 Tax=Quillaja saponaria TaxID=32244 RepID=A0AAD7PW08_QUISA|nr:hypothetical protein O6P43_012880 [Quillaja saponaria]